MTMDKTKIQKEIEKIKSTIQANKDKANALLDENTELTTKVDKLNKALKLIEKQESELAKSLDGLFEKPVKKAKKAVKATVEETKEEIVDLFKTE